MSRKNIKPPDVPCGDFNTLKFMLKALYGRERDELAERLIERFGDARGVFSATHEELTSVHGITDRVATFFNVVYPLKRRTALNALPRDLTELPALDGFAAAMLASEPYAIDVALYLDRDGVPICTERLPESELIRAAVAGACRHDAQKFVWIAHASKCAERSAAHNAELAQTVARLKDVLGILGVEFIGRLQFYDGKRVENATGDPQRTVEV